MVRSKEQPICKAITGLGMILHGVIPKRKPKTKIALLRLHMPITP